jgi:hypothetical protein
MIFQDIGIRIDINIHGKKEPQKRAENVTTPKRKIWYDIARFYARL